jgi:hypothetical protein
LFLSGRALAAGKEKKEAEAIQNLEVMHGFPCFDSIHEILFKC